MCALNLPISDIVYRYVLDISISNIYTISTRGLYIFSINLYPIYLYSDILIYILCFYLYPCIYLQYSDLPTLYISVFYTHVQYICSIYPCPVYILYLCYICMLYMYILYLIYFVSTYILYIPELQPWYILMPSICPVYTYILCLTIFSIYQPLYIVISCISLHDLWSQIHWVGANRNDSKVNGNHRDPNWFSKQSRSYSDSQNDMCIGSWYCWVKIKVFKGFSNTMRWRTSMPHFLCHFQAQIIKNHTPTPCSDLNYCLKQKHQFLIYTKSN